ncbi:MAG: adenylosuccinate synthase [Fibrobacterota bacterium]
MANRIVIGSQWGDEGKAKIVDFLTSESDVVVRFQGGANAGHTVITGENTYIFHLIPAGIMHPDKVCIVGNGVVLDPLQLLKEIDELREKGISAEGRLFISDRAHVVMPYHKKLDKVREKKRGKKAIGTTGRGIGPAYEDRVARCGIRVGDLLHKERFLELTEANLDDKNSYFEKFYDAGKMTLEENVSEYVDAAERIRDFVCDTSSLANKFIKDKKSLLFEGAQGTILDVDHGTYPFVTSSNTIAGAACAGSGVGPTRIDEVIGVVKAYTTRVGNGPFPTELDNDIGEKIRKDGGEFGATTGRPRRCGWFDSVILKKAVQTNGLDKLAVTKLDVLDGLDEIKICTGYRVDGKDVSDFPADISLLEKVEPVYETVEGWNSETSNIRSFKDLPEKARGYLGRLEELCETEVLLVSVGPDREQTFLKKS